MAPIPKPLDVSGRHRDVDSPERLGQRESVLLWGEAKYGPFPALVVGAGGELGFLQRLVITNAGQDSDGSIATASRLVAAPARGQSAPNLLL